MTLRHCIGELEVRLAERQVLVAGRPAVLQAKAFDLLVALIERRDRVVPRAELYETVWAGRVVEDNNLAVQVHALRKLLGDRCVATVPGRGYRFTLTEEPAPALAPPQAAAYEPPAERSPAAVIPHLVDRPAPADAPRASQPPLPLPASALHGRDDELAAVGPLLARHRLVTVVGPGGIGKTVFALAAAHHAAAARQGNELALRGHPPEGGGAVWIELAQILDATLLPSTVARAFGLALAGADPVRALAAALVPVRSFIVLDNAEHLLDAVAKLAAALLAKAPGVRLLITSQAALKIEGERVFRLNALAVPESGCALAEAKAFGAVALFAEAASAADRRFALAESNIAKVIEVCRQLDGLPLALELAAARLPFLGLNGLLARLAERLQLIGGGGRRDAPTRQQTLRAALEWSHGLLSPNEQLVFRRLGVFVGGFTLELAAELARDDTTQGHEHGHDGAWVVEMLAALVDRSLVDASDDDPPRYRLLESAREHALGRLEAAGEIGALRRRHAQVIAAWMEREAIALMTHRDEEVLPRVVPELDNVRAALRWCVERDPPLAVALIGASFRPFQTMDLLAEWTRLSNAIAAALTPGIPARIAGRYWVTRAQSHLGRNYRAAHGFAVEAEALFRTADDRPGLYWALCAQLWSRRAPQEHAARLAAEAVTLEQAGLPARLLAVGRLGQSHLHWYARRYPEAARDIDSALAHARAAGDHRYTAIGTCMRAMVHYLQGEFDAGVRLMHHSALSGRQRYGYPLFALGCLALGLVLQGERAEARAVLAEFFRRSRAADWQFFNLLDESYTLLAMQEGRHRSAALLLGYSDQRVQQLTDIRLAETQVQLARAQLEATFDAPTLRHLLDDGAALDEDAVCALALEEPVTT